MSKTLTDFQLVALSSAARRDDRCLIPPPKLRGRPLKAFEEKLIAAGMVREIRATETTPIWRTDPATGRSYSLKLTIKGERASAESSVASRTDAPDKVKSDGKIENVADGGARKDASEFEGAHVTMLDEPPASNLNAAAASGQERGEVSALADRSEPRANSKLAVLVDLLSRDRGATLSELTSATGWLPHTTRAAMTRLRQRGFGLERFRNEAGGASIFRIRSDRHPAQGAGQ